jgi:hypothetical protein
VAAKQRMGFAHPHHRDVGRVAQAQVAPARAARVEMEVGDEEPFRSKTVTHPVEGGRSQRRLGVEQKAKRGDHIGRFREQSGIDGDVPQHETGGRASLTCYFDHRGADVDPNHLGDPLSQKAQDAPGAAGEVDGALRRRMLAKQPVDEAALEHPLQPSGRAGIPEVAVIRRDLTGVQVGLAIRSAGRQSPMMPNGATGMRVSVRKVLGGYADAWDSLVESLPIPSPFLRSWWVDTAAGSRPCIVLVLQGVRLVGGLALERDRHLGVERLRLLGAGALCPDHLDAIAASEMRAEVAAVLGAWLTRPGDRILDLDGVVSDSLVAVALPHRFRCERSAVAPWSALSSRYLERCSPTLRRVVHKTERRLVRETGSCIVERVDDVELGLRLLHRLHAQRWGKTSSFLGDFGRFATVCRAAAARGELLIDVLRAGDEAGAIVFSFEVAGRLSSYQSGRIPAPRWRGAGIVLLARVFDDAARRGMRDADLLRGDEAYKTLFADGQRDVWRLRGRVGSRALVALQIDLAAERGRRLAGKVRRRLRPIAARRHLSQLSSESGPDAGGPSASVAPRSASQSP